jgi:hypothetical protein
LKDGVPWKNQVIGLMEQECAQGYPFPASKVSLRQHFKTQNLLPIKMSLIHSLSSFKAYIKKNITDLTL